MVKQMMIVLGVVLLLITGCSKTPTQDTAEVGAADALALKYIEASTEGNHDLFKQILSPDDPHYLNLKDGRHVNPGMYKAMGERYTIQRFEQDTDDAKELYYKVTYYSPKHNGYFTDYLEMKKEAGDWKISEIDSRDISRKITNPEGGVIVHENKEGDK
jgi:hypothetical protein